MRVRIMSGRDVLYIKENCNDISGLLTEHAQIQFTKDNNLVTGFYECHVVNLDKNEVEIVIGNIEEDPIAI